ncbi:type II toxin-antitoxin system MqsA family antitoxin [Turneriella parva]|uniref:Zinc finger, YgiT-type n=1 Tax=Turneriella parva (strain ATCC BAA-1111 / DSM 21527 / NCTC 11395 / H) TaxID=869212 RepID=I4B555_TURPD|nr:type II toxin-antitoxin system MqsA family antitoxin [Turneriella parva]AFM12412.1 hypothetical protein Turpa_1765 [Turneriella parva DSM 21527]
MIRHCNICKTGELKPGLTHVTLNRKSAIIIIKDVPAEICDNCGEFYLDEPRTEAVLAIAENASRSGSEVEIKRFQAA